MRVIHTTPRKINIVRIDDHELTGLNVVTAATLLDTQKGPIIGVDSDQDLQNYPHVFFTSPDIWDASVLDHEITPSLLEDINQHSDDSLLQDSIFDECGDLHHRAIQTLNIFCDLLSLPSGEPITHASLHDSNPAEEDWKTLRPYFGWQSEQVIKNTYKVTS